MVNNIIDEIIEKGHRNAIIVKLHGLIKATTTHLSKPPPEGTGIGYIAINKTLTELCKSGYVKKVEKKPNADQRNQEYELTDRGRGIAHFIELLDGFGPEVPKPVMSHFEKVVKHLKKVVKKGKIEEDDLILEK